jgi:excisionase family DNA binding protein
MTLADLKRAAELLAPGSCITVSRHALLAAIASAEPANFRSVEPQQPDRLLTVAEVATRLGISRKHVYQRAHRWPFTRKLGVKSLRFEQRGLERWLARQGADANRR